MYGSMSSLPSVSSIGSRHLYNNKDKRAREERKGRGAGKDKNYNKRFQRLESHVVTLARSVAHLSSEMRTQHVIVQEIEQIRAELQQVKMNRYWASLEREGGFDILILQGKPHWVSATWGSPGARRVLQQPPQGLSANGEQSQETHKVLW